MVSIFSTGMPNDSEKLSHSHELISIIVPVYNESSIIERHLTLIYEYLSQLPFNYSWELIVVDDGSLDESATLAKNFAAKHERVSVFCHAQNVGLGQALRTGFAHSEGKWIVCLDLDLTYSPEHITQLLDAKRDCKVVMASPYTIGGTASNIPWMRRYLSLLGNKFLSVIARRRFSTFTCMVRLYQAQFIRTLELKSNGAEINLEIFYKAILAGADIKEIPAHLNWQLRASNGRISCERIMREIGFVFLYGFLLFNKRNLIMGDSAS